MVQKFFRQKYKKYTIIFTYVYIYIFIPKEFEILPIISVMPK